MMKGIVLVVDLVGGGVGMVLMKLVSSSGGGMVGGGVRGVSGMTGGVTGTSGGMREWSGSVRGMTVASLGVAGRSTGIVRRQPVRAAARHAVTTPTSPPAATAHPFVRDDFPAAFW